MFVLRPAAHADLPQIERMATQSAIGITSLPPDRAKLTEKIERSIASFSVEVDVPGEESYFFVLENVETGELAGTSGIAASAGFHDRFYSYRNEIIVHASQDLKVSNKIHALHLCHDLTGYSLLTSFFIDPALADTRLPQLLSRARLLFIAEHRRRFADKLAAENPGVCDNEGRSPFWDAVGRRFFNMAYPQAERLSGGRSRTFIAELMPQYPIYVPLLPPSAQLAIGQLHPDGELPFSILIDEGFDPDTYIDIFDGGPTVEARLSTLATLRHQRRAVWRGESAAAAVDSIAANTALANFRATLAPVSHSGRDAGGSTQLAELLALSPGDALRHVPVLIERREGSEA
ncbi:MAG: arginine N-succinyltransferase [Betaproteobacteria bacterium]|nr:arginine N-succinyltransferase [Betaproteobacteria bacterium]